MNLDLKFTTRSFYKLESEYDISVMDLDVEQLGFKEIIHVVWAGMQHHDNPPSVDDVIDKVDISKMDELAEQLDKAILEAFPQAEETEKN